jgi:hypothetical protein
VGKVIGVGTGVGVGVDGVGVAVETQPDWFSVPDINSS